MWQCDKPVDRVPVSYYAAFMHTVYEKFGNDMQVNCVGGEPLLKPGVYELLRQLSQWGFFSALTTNGYLLSERNAKALMQTGVSSVTVSLDTFDEAMHDRLRGKKGVYRRAMQGIRFLHAYQKELQSVCVVATLMKPTLPGIIPLLEWAENNAAIASISFQAVDQPFYTPSNKNWREHDYYTSLWPEDETVAPIIDTLIERKNEGYKIANGISQLEGYKRYFSDPHRIIAHDGCHLGYDALSVNALGDIFLCFDQPPIGNIMREGIEDVWESNKANVVREKITACRKNCKSMMNCFSEEGFQI